MAINREHYPYIQEDHLPILAVCYRSHQALLGSDERMLPRLYKDAEDVYENGNRARPQLGVTIRRMKSDSGAVFATAIHDRSGVFIQLSGVELSKEEKRPKLMMTVGTMWSVEVVDAMRGNSSTKTWS